MEPKTLGSWDPEPRYFLWIPTSAAHAGAVYPNGTKTLSSDSLITLFTNGKPIFINGTINVLTNQHNDIILEI